MRELQDFNKASADTMQEAELINDDIRFWRVKMSFAEDDPLRRKVADAGVSHITMEAVFPEEFPLKPPFVRVVAPRMLGTFVSKTGGMCLQALSHKHWLPSLSMSSLFVGIRAKILEKQPQMTPVDGRYKRKAAFEDYQVFMKKHEWN